MISDVPPPPPDEGQKSLITPRFAVVMVASFAYFVAIGGLVTTVPRYIENELGGNGLAVGIGVGSMAVTALLLRPWVGQMGDVHGRRVLAVVGAAVVAVSILGYTLASSLWILVIARLLTGAGEAAMFVGVATAAQDLAPDDRRGEAASYFSLALYGGLGVGPILGETLLDRGFTTLWVALAGSATVAALVSLLIPRGRTVAVAPDRPFLQVDAVGPGVILFLGLIPFTAYSAFVPLFAEDLGHETVGGVFALYAGLVFAVRVLGARLPDRLGWRLGSAIALCCVTAGIGLVAVWGSMVSIWLAAVVLAAGMSLLYPALFTAVMGAAPESERTHAVGTFSVFFDLSTALGASLVGLVVALSGDRGGFAVAALLGATGLAVQWMLRDRIGRRRLQPVVDDSDHGADGAAA